MNNWKMQRNLKMKKIAKKSEIITILFINLRVYEELNCLMSDWASHSMNNSIVYEESFNSTKKTRVSRETNNAMIEDQRFYWLIQ
jgi:oligoribonuclease NrnB/cAMP/cGMP phosphodiesterase (DHH superfamily)